MTPLIKDGIKVCKKSTERQILMLLFHVLMWITNSVMFTRSQYPYFSQVDKTEQKTKLPAKQIPINSQLLVTFDTEAERLIKEYIWIDHG